MSRTNDSVYFEEIKNFCLSLANAREDFPKNKITFKVNRRIFMLTDEQQPLRVTLKSLPERNQILLEHPDISVASYLGQFGWISIDITSQDALELARDLIAESYLIVSKQKSMSNGGYDARKF